VSFAIQILDQVAERILDEITSFPFIKHFFEGEKFCGSLTDGVGRMGKKTILDRLDRRRRGVCKRGSGRVLAARPRITVNSATAGH